MFVQLVYFSRPSLLRKACSSRLHPYKHTNILLFAFKERGPALYLHANEEPRGEMSLPIKGRGSPEAFVPAPARPALLTRGVHGPQPAPRLASGPGPTPLTAHTSPGPRPSLPCYAHHRQARPERPAKPTAESPTRRMGELNSQDSKLETEAGGSGYCFSWLRAQDALTAALEPEDEAGSRTPAPERGQRWIAHSLQGTDRWEVGLVPAFHFGDAGI